MAKKHSESEKQLIINRYIKCGESISTIAKDTGVPRSTLYSWVKQTLDKKANGKAEVSVRNFRLLENKVKRLEGIIEIIKKSGCSSNDPLSVKLPALETLQGEYNVHMLCEALDVPRGTYYNFIYRNKRTNTWYSKRREELR